MDDQERMSFLRDMERKARADAASSTGAISRAINRGFATFARWMIEWGEMLDAEESTTSSAPAETEPLPGSECINRHGLKPGDRVLCVSSDKPVWWTIGKTYEVLDGRLRDNQGDLLPGVSARFVPAAADRDELKDCVRGLEEERDKLRGAILMVRDGKYPMGSPIQRYRPDGAPSPHDRCVYGTVHAKHDCPACAQGVLNAALNPTLRTMEDIWDVLDPRRENRGPAKPKGRIAVTEAPKDDGEVAHPDVATVRRVADAFLDDWQSRNRHDAAPGLFFLLRDFAARLDREEIARRDAEMLRGER